MKTQVQQTEIVRSGVANSKEFTIKGSAAAFQILSDKLYPDKIRAVIRELSSNAWDAHVAAGNTNTPFQVHLPNDIEPWFAIRDYGTGLSHDDVTNLYTTYFHSTKSDSNDFTGALGLGSKVGFAYAESFTVTSYFNGDKNIYIVDIGESGVPTVSLVQGSPFKTDEHNGLEVKISVKRQDFREFVHKAQQIYRIYPLLPTVVGYPEFNVNRYEYELEGKDWRLVKSSDRYGMQSIAIQGTVYYPIQPSKLQGIDYDTANKLNNLSLELDFDIGDLEISASREELGYNERTSKNIIQKMNNAISEITKIMDQNLKDCESWWDAACLYNKYKSQRNSFAMFLERGLISSQWRGKPISDSSITIEKDYMKDHNIFFHSNVNRSYYYKTNTVMKHEDYFYISVNPNTTFVLDDLKIGGLVRFRNYINNRNNQCFMMRSNQNVALTEKDMTEFLKHIGYENCQYIKTSDMPKPESSTKAAISKGDDEVKVPQFKYDPYYNSSASNWTSSHPVKVSQGGYYIEIFKYDVDLTGSHQGKWHYTDAKALVNLATAFGLITDKDVVYGLFRADRKKVKEKGKGWINLVDLLYDYAESNKSLLTTIRSMEECRRKLHNRIGFNSRIDFFVDLEKHIPASKKECPIRVFSHMYNGMNNKKINVDSTLIDRLFRSTKIEINENTATNVGSLETVYKNILTKYPLLRYDLTKPDALAYIKLVDDANKVVDTTVS